MAIINCPECGKEISEKSNNCPHCGFPLQNYRIKGKLGQLISNKIIKVILILGLLFLILGTAQYFLDRRATEHVRKLSCESAYLDILMLEVNILEGRDVWPVKGDISTLKQMLNDFETDCAKYKDEIINE